MAGFPVHSKHPLDTSVTSREVQGIFEGMRAHGDIYRVHGWVVHQTFGVITGLDPVIHLLRTNLF
jgi:hypothetical protein